MQTSVWFSLSSGGEVDGPGATGPRGGEVVTAGTKEEHGSDPGGFLARLRLDGIDDGLLRTQDERVHRPLTGIEGEEDGGAGI